MAPKFIRILACCFLVLVGPVLLQSAVVENVGSYSDWPTEWNPINGLNDPVDSGTTIDFVGDSNDPGVYWADNGDYIFFRLRTNVGSAPLGTFTDSHFVLIDVDNYLFGTGFGSDTVYLPDLGFSWDSKSNDVNKHGLEMMVYDTGTTTWNNIRMDDIDGSAGQKLVNDINGSGRTTDGYVRTIDGQSTTSLGNTTYIDIAVSWSYMTTYTDLEKGQDWRITVASIANATDHNALSGDIGGGATPSSSNSVGWETVSGVPEPGTTVSMLGIAALFFGLLPRLREYLTQQSDTAARSR